MRGGVNHDGTTRRRLRTGRLEECNGMGDGKKRLLWIVLGGLLVIGCVALLFQIPALLLPGRGPSELVVQVDGAWEQVRITSFNMKSPQVFRDSAKPIRVEQIVYGRYVTGIRYKDNKTLWLECYHTDAGMAKAIHVSVKREAGANKAAVETICTYQSRPPTVDFSKNVVMDETSENTPCRIWGGP